jgi:predicted PurR-regulated permease PerM
VVSGRRRGSRTALAILLCASFLATAWIASPIWCGLIFGIVMAFTTQPLYRRILALGSRTQGGSWARHPYRAAAVVVLLSALVAMIVGSVSLYTLARELLVIGRVLQETFISTAHARQSSWTTCSRRGKGRPSLLLAWFSKRRRGGCSGF